MTSFRFTFGNVSSNMSTMAASRYSLHASAFFDICSASAFALAEIANASASPRILIYKNIEIIQISVQFVLLNKIKNPEMLSN